MSKGNDDDSQVLDDILRENEVVCCAEIIKRYTLLLWDGLGFFGTATYKLRRLRGKKVGWCDKFKSA